MKSVLIAIAMTAGSLLPLIANGQTYEAAQRYNEGRTIRNPVFFYPNPASNNINLILNDLPLEKIYVDILDFNGNRRNAFVFAPGSMQLNMDISYLERGFYILRIHEERRLVAVLKLTKE